MPTAFVYLPAGALVQVADPLPVEYRPAWQLSHWKAKSAEYWPGAQMAHVEAPEEAEYFPAVHFWIQHPAVFTSQSMHPIVGTL